MQGMKAQIKQELRSRGIKTITTDEGRQVKLQNAKTSDLISVLTKA